MPGKTGAGVFPCTAFASMAAAIMAVAIMLGACLAITAPLTVPAFAQQIDRAPGETRAVALPRLLGESDIKRYRRIFALQERGDLAAAAKIIATLDDRILMGHVLAQKYLHPTAHRSKFSELKPWLAEYGDHPDARRLYRLAMKRKPAGAKPPKRPSAAAGARLPGGESEYVAPRIPGRGINRSQRKRLSGLQRDMRGRIRRGWPTGARQILTSKAHLGLASKAQFDAYQARIAWSYYLYDKDELAFELAAASAERSRQYVADADWTAGLAAWRLGRLEAAAHHFARLAESTSASPWLRTSGAYWAARSELRLRRPQYVSYWLERAASEARTFYGLLATRALGREPALNWRSSILTEAHLAELAGSPAARRARALAQVGQSARAERELRALWPRATPALASAILPLAERLGLAAVQMALGAEMRRRDGQAHDGAAFPLPGWAPEGGYAVDRALIFALIRQESKFKASAKSRLGARGLMQLMPATARFAARRERIKGVNSHTLLNPELNIALGQSYVRHLLAHKAVNGNIFYLLCAYNAGPGNLKKWMANTNFDEDALLFIESIRSRETRQFIERVIASYWIYRMRLGQPTPSLDATASGLWPNYAAQERSFADNE
ncbi:MAG: lytic transglycosylase domain-containing protein [Alphaproteobacteria bacterium]|nr:lytic transglycosylase domain-containing protein [Alphaproteobacteria bacterium]MDP6590162.1 lytic transglycosylase domain-containing protein [Alphaproteobacteria bacterium]MDP6817500.1 lytic transglycosylase domain-containing protein [Alphaproteobacteria bacterium]